MKLRTAIVAVALLLLAGLTSCGSVRRLGKSATLGVLSPAIAVYGGSVDAYASSKSVQKGLQEDDRVSVWFLPFSFIYHAGKHLVYGATHILDVFLFPFYGFAELSGLAGEVEPLQIYTGTPFDKDEEDKSSTDAVSGEVTPAPATGS